MSSDLLALGYTLALFAGCMYMARLFGLVWLGRAWVFLQCSWVLAVQCERAGVFR